MPGVSFMLAVLLGGAAFLFYQAAAEVSVGTAWASNVCSSSHLFCHHPEYLAYAGGAFLIFAISAKVGNMAN